MLHTFSKSQTTTHSLPSSLDSPFHILDSTISHHFPASTSPPYIHWPVSIQVGWTLASFAPTSHSPSLRAGCSLHPPLIGCLCSSSTNHSSESHLPTTTRPHCNQTHPTIATTVGSSKASYRGTLRYRHLCHCHLPTTVTGTSSVPVLLPCALSPHSRPNFVSDAPRCLSQFPRILIHSHASLPQ